VGRDDAHVAVRQMVVQACQIRFFERHRLGLKIGPELFEGLHVAPFLGYLFVD
jgi:hypothetical protein